MPYGATYSPIAGSSTMKTNSTNQHVDGHNLALEPGPVSVSATWTGEEQCDLYLSRTGAELLRLSSIERKAGGGCAPRQQSNSEPSRATESISTSAEAGQEPANPPVQSPSSQPCLSAPGGGVSGIANRQFRPGRDAAEGRHRHRGLERQRDKTNQDSRWRRSGHDADVHAYAAFLLRQWWLLPIHATREIHRRDRQLENHFHRRGKGRRDRGVPALGQRDRSQRRGFTLHHHLPAFGRSSCLIHAGGVR